MARFAVGGTATKRRDADETPRASATSASASPRSSYAKPWDWMPSVLAASRASDRERPTIRAGYPRVSAESIRIRARSFVALFSPSAALPAKGESNRRRSERNREGGGERTRPERNRTNLSRAFRACDARSGGHPAALSAGG